MLDDGAIAAGPVRTPYETSYHGVQVEIDPDDLWAAIVGSVTGLRPGSVDLIGLTALGPAFIACVAYIDPGNFATNIQGGAQFGYLLVWVIVASKREFAGVRDVLVHTEPARPDQPYKPLPSG